MQRTNAGDERVKRRQQNTSQLFDAIRDEKPDTIRELIALEIDWTSTIQVENQNHTPLRQLSHHPNMWDLFGEVVKRIEEQKPITSSYYDSLQCGSAILRAASHNKPEIVRLLLTSKLVDEKYKSNILSWYYGWHFLDKPNDLALHAAVRNNSAEIVTLLINHGYTQDRKNGEDLTPAKLAVQLKSWACLRLLSKNAADFKECPADILLNMMMENVTLDGEGYHDEALQDKRLDVFKALLDLPANKKENALKMAKNKDSLLGNYLLCYHTGFLEALFGSGEKSAETIEKRIDDEIDTINRKKSSVVKMNSSLGISGNSDDGSFSDIELETPNRKINSGSDSDSDTLDSLEEKLNFGTQHQPFTLRK